MSFVLFYLIIGFVLALLQHNYIDQVASNFPNSNSIYALTVIIIVLFYPFLFVRNLLTK